MRAQKRERRHAAPLPFFIHNILIRLLQLLRLLEQLAKAGDR